ncbi:DUF815 domain-containing protein [Helicobacter didelphidarum]|nr:DUF815 domain-containing protein [Helicobacter didelphidarum]
MRNFKDFQEIIHIDWKSTKVAIFRNIHNFIYLHQINEFDFCMIDDLLGLESQIQLLDSNTLAFLSGKKALNALLWGARGCGKSSVVKAVLAQYLFDKTYKIPKNGNYHAKKCIESTSQDIQNISIHSNKLRVLQLDSNDISFLPLLFDSLRQIQDFYFVIFCDDIAFCNNDWGYHGLKSILEGSFERPPNNILLYATSNLRHIISENEHNNSLHIQDSLHESMSFSDRFPLSIGFYTLGQKEYLEVLLHLIKNHLHNQSLQAHSKITLENNNIDRESQNILEKIKQQAINFATKIGNRSPRSAKDFFTLYLNGTKL